MMREYFDNYRFSIDTQIQVNEKWHRVKSVDFYKALIETTDSTFTISQIDNIKD
jgi:hypothetical protein